MNYGYNESSKYWKEDKKQELAKRLSKELKILIGYVAGFGNLYLEIDGSYGGVRIRHMTQLTDKEIDELVEKADKVYDEVMKNGNL